MPAEYLHQFDGKQIDVEVLPFCEYGVLSFGLFLNQRFTQSLHCLYTKIAIFSYRRVRGSRPSRAFAFVPQNKNGSSLSRGATSLRLQP
jgi:hypothetical protein